MSLKEFHIDAVYPEPLSRLHAHANVYRRAVKKKMNRGAVRYRTQPVTFDEIKEVDEECVDESAETSAGASSKSEVDLKSQFEEFYKSIRAVKKGLRVTEEGSKSPTSDHDEPRLEKGPRPDVERDPLLSFKHQPRPSI